MHVVQHRVVSCAVFSRCEVPLVAQLEELQLRTDRGACLDRSFLKYLDRVVLVQVQSVEELDIAQSTVGLKECWAIVDRVWLVIIWVRVDELDVLLLVGMIV